MTPPIRHLVVFPGLSSPHHPKYKPVYDLLRSHAKDSDVSITIALYPGQQSENGQFEGKLSPNAAFESAIALLGDIAKRGECFATLGISFGCTVSLVAADKLPGMEFWKRAILWGTIPHYLMCRTFIQDRDPNLGKGTRIADSPDNVFLYETPIEHLLTAVRIPVDVGLGGTDKYVHREYLTWLERLCNFTPKPPCRNFVYLEGCGHNVTTADPNHRTYLEFVFRSLQSS